MYAVLFKAKFLAIAFLNSNILFKRKEGSVFIAKKFNKVADLRLLCEN
jgi:hypothetical protein